VALKEASGRDRVVVVLPLLVLLSLFHSSASFAGDALSVQVIDQGGNAVQGARISLSRLRDTKFVTGGGVFVTPTGETGKATFPNMIAGIYRITVTCPGYVPVQLSAVPIDYAIVPRYRVDNLFVVLNRIHEAPDSR